MSKNTVWLELSGDRVLVDVASSAESYWRGMGYCEPESVAPDQPEAPVEKPARKVRGKRIVSGSEA